MSKLTKNQKLYNAKVETGKAYTLEEAAALVKEITFTKFDASTDIDVRLGVDPRKANQMVRGVVSPLPVSSVIRFAARPVGAASAKEMPFCSKLYIIPFKVVVFPVPGPPVRTIIL